MKLPEMPKVVVVYDTETTGFANYNKPDDDPSQAAAVQIGAKLYMRTVDGSYKHMSTFYTVIEDQGVEIGEGALKVHGISKEVCELIGMDPANAVWAFADLCYAADVIVAHNEIFDNKIVMSTAARAGHDLGGIIPKEKSFCTMLYTKPIVKAVNKRQQRKNPSLEECMQFYFGRGVGKSKYPDINDCEVCATRREEDELMAAHDALVDVDACAEVFFELLRRAETTS